MAALCLVALAGPLLLDPEAVHRQDLARRLEGPSSAHPLGLDDLGRDVLVRVIFGARTSLAAAVVVVALSSLAGAVVGGVAAGAGGAVDEMLMRLADIFLAFPGVLLAVALVGVLGPGLGHCVLALCILGWVGYARLVRGEILRLQGREWVQAARAAGASRSRVLFHHLMPHALGALAVQASLGIAGVILAEASLSFLGLGIQPPSPSWGSMLRDAVKYVGVASHLTLAPGAAIAATVLGFHLLGDSARERLDPRTAARPRPGIAVEPAGRA